MASPMRFAHVFALVAATFVLAPADVVAGGFVREPTFTAPPVCSSLTLCSIDGDCTTGMSCASFGSAGSYCADMGQDLFCCDSGAACPSVDGTATMCTPVATDSGAISLCLPPDPRFCVAPGGTLTWASVEACYRSATNPATHVYDWERGDCDGDGVANGIDVAPCVAAMTDAGTVHDASAVDVPAPVDVTVDAPANDVVAMDVAATDVVARDVATDTAANDAGRDVDAQSQEQVGEIPAVSFRGGGCRCDVPRTNERGVNSRCAALFAALVAIATGRRRVRR